MIDEGLLNTLDEFLSEYYHEDILELVEQYPSESQSLYVDWMDLYRFEMDLADDYLTQPEELDEHFEEALTQYDLPVDVDLSRASVRVFNVDGSVIYEVGQYRKKDRSQYLGISGQVAQTTEVKPHLVKGVFECQRCGTQNTVPQIEGLGYSEPHECEGCERQGPFVVDKDRSMFEDRQAIRLRQPPEQTKGGKGASIDVFVTGDEADVAEPGDRVIISGTLKLEQSDDGPDFDFYHSGSAITIEETDYEEIDTAAYRDEIEALAAGEHGDPYDLLVDSIGPKIAGHEQIKLALALQLFGGNKVDYPDGTTGRGDSHVLLIGDPGTAKSSLLRYIETIAPRSVYASGKGASAAGLTAAAVSDDFGEGEWSLDAGALVEANKGIGCIDEIDKVKEDAVSSLHDALESQRVTVNKAGINATLPAETSLLAAGNPKHGRFDRYQSIGDQIDLGPTLLSRFDLIFVLSDRPEEEQDREITEQIIESRQAAIRSTRGDNLTDEEKERIEPAVEPDVLEAWIAHARQTARPVIEDSDVQQMLTKTFVDIRLKNADETESPVPVTFRKLEGFQRLAEASARIRLSETVEKQDIERARAIVIACLEDVGLNEDGDYDTDVIETGTSTTQRKRIQTLGNLIQELQSMGEYDDGIPEADIIQAGVEEGFSASKVEHAFQKMKDQGDVYEPETDRWRKV